MKTLLSIFLVFCALAFTAADDSIALKAGDSLRIMLDDGSGVEIKVTAIPKPVAVQAPAAAPVEQWETVFEQVCVNGSCSIQPVRRLVSRAAIATARVVTAPMVALASAGCGCGCSNCVCAPAVTTTRTRLFFPRFGFLRR